jgi:hypothetical protein
MASSISTVAVDFVANVAKYMSGLDTMASKTKTWSEKTKKDTQGATDAFDGTSKAINNLAKQLIALVAIEKVGAAFANAAKQVSQLADEAEKVGASAEQFDKLRLAAERNGANIGDVKIAYKELQKSINEALGGTKATTDAFRALGVSYSNLATLNPDERFLAIADALSKVQDQNERARLGVVLLGKAYTELSPLIAKGGSGIQTGGRGALSQKDIESIDKVTKSFEEVSRVLDIELKRALTALAPALTTIASALTYIIENLGKISVIFAIAFAPFALIKFQRALISLSSTILSFIINAKDAANAAKFLSGIDVIKGPSKATVESLSAFRILLLQIASISGTISSYLLPALASIVVTAAQVANLSKEFLKLSSYTTAWIAVFVPGMKNLAPVAKQLNDSAKGVNNLSDSVLRYLGIKSSQKPLQGPNVLIGPVISKAEMNRLSGIQDESDAMLERQRAFAKATDAYNVKALEFKTNIEASVVTPLEELQNALMELDDAWLFGGLNIDAYNRKLDELKYKYSKLITDVAGLTKTAGILSTVSAPEPAKTTEQFSRTRIEPIANLSAIGMKTTPYATAGEKLFLDLVTKSKFETADLTKANLDLQAAREKAVKMAPELYDSTRKESEILQKRVTDIQSAATATDEYGKKIIDVTVASRALAQAQADLFAATTPYWQNIIEFTKNFADGLASAIVAGQSFGDALKNVFQDVLKQIAVLIIRTTILQAIMASIGLASAPAALAFGQMTGIVGKASGGPVTGGMPYKVGEAGPEMFVPSQNGYIVPNGMTGGGATVVNQTINIQTGVSQTVRAEMAALLPTFKQQAIAGVAEAKQRGGSYAKALSAA